MVYDPSQAGVTPIFIPLSGQTDVNGDAEIDALGFIASQYAGWNLFLSLPGNAPQVTVLQNGIPIAAASAMNGQINLGPIYSGGSAGATIEITGADPSEPIQGYISGQQSTDPNALGLSGPTSLTVGTVTSYDGQSLIQESAALGNNIHTTDTFYPSTTGVFDVHNWASMELGINMNTNVGNAVVVNMRWFSESTGQRLVGQQSFLIDDLVGTATCTIPHLGPFLRIGVTRLFGTSSWNWNFSVLTSQRIVGNPYGGNFNPYLLENEQVNFAVGTTLLPFGTLYGGACWLALRAVGGQPGTFRVSSLGFDGAYHSGNVYQIALTAGGTQYQSIILPPAPCRGEMVNTGAGSAAFTFNVFPSATGSS